MKTAENERISIIAAELGARGGRISKRPPGALRRILTEVCGEIGSYENHDVFRYWQQCSIAALADNAQEGTCWFKHGLFAYPGTDGNESRFYYFDGKLTQRTNAATIRKLLWKIRQSPQALIGNYAPAESNHDE